MEKSVENGNNETQSYSFIVAGHTYGNPMKYQYGLYPQFKQSTDYLNSIKDLRFGVLTGDVVPKPTKAYWDAAELDIHKINTPIYIAPGNHDQSDVFYKRYPPRNSFTFKNDHFVILRTNRWNIEGEELNYLKKCIDSLTSEKERLFIFTHEVVWWTPNGRFAELEPNYSPAYPNASNFWEEVFPILDSLPNSVYLFSGDVGATKQVTPFYYDRIRNIHFLSSGMGNGSLDNVLIVNVRNESQLRIKLLHLNSSQIVPLGKF